MDVGQAGAGQYQRRLADMELELEEAHSIVERAKGVVENQELELSTLRMATQQVTRQPQSVEKFNSTWTVFESKIFLLKPRTELFLLSDQGGRFLDSSGGGRVHLCTVPL